MEDPIDIEGAIELAFFQSFQACCKDPELAGVNLAAGIERFDAWDPEVNTDEAITRPEWPALSFYVAGFNADQTNRLTGTLDYEIVVRLESCLDEEGGRASACESRVREAYVWCLLRGMTGTKMHQLVPARLAEVKRVSWNSGSRFIEDGIHTSQWFGVVRVNDPKLAKTQTVNRGGAQRAARARGG